VVTLPVVLRGVGRSDGRADDDISEQSLARQVVIVVERERQDIGRPILPHVFTVEFVNGIGVDKQQIEFAGRDASMLECRLSERRPTAQIDHQFVLFVNRNHDRIGRVGHEGLPLSLAAAFS